MRFLPVTYSGRRMQSGEMIYCVTVREPRVPTDENVRLTGRDRHRLTE